MPPELKRALDEAGRALERGLPAGLDRTEADRLVSAETAHSAAIEDEYNPERTRAHARALAKYLRAPAGEEAMLRMHREMMKGQAHAQPGMYRTVGVSVGRHRPPPPAQVPELMGKLWEYVSLEGENRVERAAWAHIVFETVHPFADGNGRTGRALIGRILEKPLPLSRWIFSHREGYYNLLDSGTGPGWLEWFALGVREESERVATEREELT